jgi:putative glutamine amidotransferase
VRPLIGIPPVHDDRGRLSPGRTISILDVRYARAVESMGAMPVYLPLQQHEGPLVDRLDGLLVPGGGDFLPERSYPPGVEFDATSPAQLDFDARLLARALERGIPVLGVCYGMQLLAVHHGGSLHYDIATDLPGARAHRLPEPEGRHPLALERGTRLAEILDGEGGAVNSRHHQAVARAGRGLRVCARAEDGVIEAVERVDGPFCIGVQWHPERMEDGHRERLFGAFVRACGGA